VNERIEIFRYEAKQTQRLDKYLVACLPEFSRSRLQALVKDGLVSVNGTQIYKTGQSLEPGSVIRITIPPPEPCGLVPEPIPLNVIFENANLLIVNKPAGMVVHPAYGHSGGTLVHAALAHAPEITGVGGEKRPGVVHRLDKNTSGIILLAKNDTAHHWLQDQFRLHRVSKIYLALVDGKPPTSNGRVEASIGRSSSQRKLMAIVTPQKGRQAISEYHTLEAFPSHTLLEVHPITGRTHQIRLHLQFIGCPVAGDTLYGHQHSSIPISRHFLHAFRLTIRLPSEDTPRTFEAPLPDELENVLKQLRRAD
jgi:23S rRNA pseudouridine1911/1915/1917 synthase